MTLSGRASTSCDDEGFVIAENNNGGAVEASIATTGMPDDAPAGRPAHGVG